MLDFTNYIYNLVSPSVKAIYPDGKIAKKYQNTESVFPYVTITDIGNTEISHTLSYTERHSLASWQFDIYADGSTGEIVAKEVRDVIMPIMENKLHMTRITAKPVTNALDTTIYRYVLQYQCKIDEERKIIYS